MENTEQKATETATTGLESLTADQQTKVGNVDYMRESFYTVALHLFEAAKNLKPFDVLYTDVLLGQAQYFLNLADNPDMLFYISTVEKEMPLKDLASKIPDDVKSKIEEYSKTIKERLAAGTKL